MSTLTPAAGDPPTPVVVPVAAAEEPRARISHRRTPKFTIWRVLVMIVAALLSYVAVGQLRGPDRFQAQLAGESEGDLARILSSLSDESRALQDELASLKVQLATIQSSSAEQGAASAQVQAQLNSLEVLAGTVPVAGPGIEATINDPSGAVTYDIVVNTVQELRDSGAEAIAVNGRRVGAASFFAQSDGRILLDGVPLPLPYAISAIGPASTMESGLRIPGGAVDTLQAITNVTVDVQRSTSLRLPALATATTAETSR